MAIWTAVVSPPMRDEAAHGWALMHILVAGGRGCGWATRPTPPTCSTWLFIHLTDTLSRNQRVIFVLSSCQGTSGWG